MLSMLQATLTLPGIAAIALALGMAIDANVLINERIREELRNGAPPQLAIQNGFAHAWATILDSNVTTLIAGLALLAFGSGPVRGFAVVHCIGILTSMFSAVFFSRGLVNLWYGGKKKLQTLAIGQVWRPEGGDTAAATAAYLALQRGDDSPVDEIIQPAVKPKAKAPVPQRPAARPLPHAPASRLCAVARVRASTKRNRARPAEPRRIRSWNFSAFVVTCR